MFPKIHVEVNVKRLRFSSKDWLIFTCLILSLFVLRDAGARVSIPMRGGMDAGGGLPFQPDPPSREDQKICIPGHSSAIECDELPNEEFEESEAFAN